MHMLKRSSAHTPSCRFMYCSFARNGHADSLSLFCHIQHHHHLHHRHRAAVNTFRSNFA